MSGTLADRIETAIGRRPLHSAPLAGGCVSTVHRVSFGDGSQAVVKQTAAGGLALEGFMLRYLHDRSNLPVPAVIHAEDRLLIMEYVDAGDGLDESVEAEAAELLADLHNLSADRFGFGRDTLIGGLHQTNPEGDDWLAFFRDHRLLYMAGEAQRAGRLPGRAMRRVEHLAGRLHTWIDGSARPSLIHGDMWGGNVLARKGRIAAFIDPAIYHADAEIELAFSTLFSTFGPAFFSRYGEIRPLRPGFFEARRDLYNLYPLLVHVRLFGGAYVGQVERILSRFGS
ncbi:MAG: fructosamine kinase [Rhodospirillaceae bacterium]|nr:fructosamine kinase [Rhodospirillaceae bacterium]